MTKIVSSFSAVATILAALLCGGAARAQSSVTWVSHTGDNSNTCDIAQSPCQTLAGAYAKTASYGEIHIIDSGEFGALNINHGIAVINDGGGTALTGGVVVDTPPGDGVILRGLTFENYDFSNGIYVSAVNTLVVDHCDMQIFQTGAAIYFAPHNAAKLEVIDSVLAFDGTSAVAAIHIAPVSGASVSAQIERVKILGPAGNGVRVDTTTSGAGAARVELKDVTVHGAAGGSGIVAVSPTSGGAPAVIVADNVTATGNAGFGVRAVGGTASVYLSRSTITNNNRGIGVSSGGAIVSYGDNRFADNLNGDGSATSTLAPK
jgi:hypothetical protein